MAQLAEAGSPGNDEEGQGDLLDDFVLSATQVCSQSSPQDPSAGAVSVEALQRSSLRTAQPSRPDSPAWVSPCCRVLLWLIMEVLPGTPSPGV